MPSQQVPTTGRVLRNAVRDFESRVMDAAREARRPRLAEFAARIDGTVVQIVALIGTAIALREERRDAGGGSQLDPESEISRIHAAIGPLLKQVILHHADAQKWAMDTERLLTPFGEEGEQVLAMVNDLATGFPAAVKSLQGHGRTFPHYPPPATPSVSNVNLFFLQNFGGPEDIERQLAGLPRDVADPILLVYEANAGLPWLPLVVAHLAAIDRQAEIQRGFWEIIGHGLHHAHALMGSGEAGRAAWCSSSETAGIQLETLQRVRANLARPAVSAELV